MSYHLVTTADERTWKHDRPILFLGNWCIRRDRRHKWENLKFEMAQPFGVNEKDRHENNAYIDELYVLVLDEITQALNRFHAANHEQRYWEILLGHWLKRYLSVAFNRYYSVEQVLKSHPISSVTRLQCQQYSLATQDSLSFIWACNDSVWNHFLYLNVLDYLGFEAPVTDNVEVDAGSDVAVSVTESKTKSVTRRIQDLLTETILPVLSRRHDAFVINSYLPAWTEVQLQISLGQVPQKWRNQSLPHFPINMELRNSLKLEAKQDKGFECFVRGLLPVIIPACYVEGYRDLIKATETVTWPRCPRFVFTSNNFDTDEVFKAWAANLALQGIPYYIGQHGNNYGTYKYMCPSIEERTADKFITWGWSKNTSVHKPAMILKLAGKKNIVPNKTGGLLLIELCRPHRLPTWDIYPDFMEYLQEQLRFVSVLRPGIPNMLTVRMHGEYIKHDMDENSFWRDHYPDIRIDTGDSSIQTLLNANRLIMHSYDSSGILETLAQNIPTMAFWQNGLSHLCDDAKPYYQTLIDCGIIHLSPQSAAEKVNMVWSDIYAWWDSKIVQNARSVFCDRYACVSENPVRKLKEILLEGVL
ncbi:MAG: transferase [Nitrospirae bacterium]|nr:transferase [Nitrospirota bacterium]